MKGWMLGLAMTLLACGGSGPTLNTRTPDGVVATWIAAVQANDADRAYSLGTPAWAARERSWAQGLTRTITMQGVRLEVVEQSPAQVVRDEALVKVRAVMHRPGAEPDNEGLNFGLRKVQGRWRISGLR
jgi:hypothetical protein